MVLNAFFLLQDCLTIESEEFFGDTPKPDWMFWFFAKQRNWNYFKLKKRVLNGFFVTGIVNCSLVLCSANEIRLSVKQQKLKNERIKLFIHWHVDMHLEKGSDIPIVTYKLWHNYAASLMYWQVFKWANNEQYIQEGCITILDVWRCFCQRWLSHAAPL